MKLFAKRALPILLAFLMLFSVIPMQVFADDTGAETLSDTDNSISDYESFLNNLMILEYCADEYITYKSPGSDPVDLMIKYIRTGVDRYNSGSWDIMAGYEDADFADFVDLYQDLLDENFGEGAFSITALKNLNNFTLPNGDNADLGHVFGTMDITYHNSGSENHADVGGWAGDLVDLLELSDTKGVSGELEDMVAEISEKYLGKDFSPLAGFSLVDIYGDLDAYYIMQNLDAESYECGMLTELFTTYFTEDLNAVTRAEYLLKNRLGTTGTRAQVREAVYNAYTSNKVISTLEGTRDFTSDDLATLRKACCYAFADYLCELAGDYVENIENPYVNVFSNEISTLAPGVTQEIKYATSADNKQMVYYVATADITRSDVNVYANYNNNDPAAGWAMSRVLDQANAAQEKYGNPDSEHYIENYNVIASTNGAGFDMSTGEPGGLLVMGGVEYHAINANGFFGILKDGTAVIGTTEEYNTVYKDQVQEGIAAFGATLVKDGEIAVTSTTDYYDDRASRTAVGITKTGKVVLMVLDGRQEPVSCGGSMIEIAQIMLDAGCVQAVNLDGGGSTTYVAKQVGDDELSVVNKPSDGFARSVSASLMMVSTAPNSTKFDHAVIESDYSYLTKDTSINLSAMGVSATGNEVELPENTYWEISDETYGTITEDGIFTAVKEGTVDVYLVSDEAIIGTKTLYIVSPDTIYFSKETIDAVYGANVTLPIVALYQKKTVAINENDIVFTLNNAASGAIAGFTFVGDESSGIKVAYVNAALAVNSEATATLNINLYKQGEATFDFEQATGGDRTLAWYRQVSNSTTDDQITYTIVDTDEDMVTSYTVALDMTYIPIPEVLEDLTYMLPGADIEGASAWMFLCQLAERISPLTEVKATLNFDTDFYVDYSDITLVNEYFTLTDKSFNEETNTLVLTLKWQDQTKAIDITTANPLCIVSGITLTPKTDADWGSKSRLVIENTGDISYEIYMKASALYTFASKEENQQIYGLYPYINSDNSEDKGGYFGETYTEFYDTYNLVGTLKDGWVSESGGFAYYVNGEKLTGICEIDGYYYDFGESGFNAGQTKYTGVFLDESAGVYRYSKLGVITSGWNMIGGEWYYFHSSTMAAATGRTKMYGVYYTFEETGRLTTGVWGNTLEGTRYYYGPTYYEKGWQMIDGNKYYFKDGYRLTGYNYVPSQEIKTDYKWYDFGEDGICRDLEDGFYEIDGGLYYIVDGVHNVGLHKIDGAYYFFSYTGSAVCGKSYYAWETHCDLPCGTYAFGLDGKMVNGLAEMNDGTYYYVNGKVVSDKAGLTKIGNDYYFISTKGRCATGKYYAWATNCDLPTGNYEFGADGKMLQGIVEKEDGHYYYINGKVASNETGLNKIGNDYYFVASNGRCATGKYYAWATNCDLPIGNYEFGADGKMLQGIVEKEDGHYYYINGKVASNEAGLTKIGDDYYFVASNGRCATGKYYAWATNCDLPKGNYEFGADGKMLQGIVEKEDGIYYYVNGKPASNSAGLTKIGEDYYFVASNGRCATGKYYAWATNCDLPEGNYEFGTDGKLLQGIVIKDDGIYCYINGQLGGGVAGLTKIGDVYYFVSTSGKCATGTYNAWATNCDLPVGTYEFGADGKMLNGFITSNDGIYYYINGKHANAGLYYVDGYYYFVTTSGKLVTNKDYYVWETNGLLIEATYTFNELGQIIG